MFEKAVKDFEKTWDIQVKNNMESTMRHKTAFNLGIVYRRLGQLQKSIEILKKATRLSHAKAATANNLGLSYFEIEDFYEAQENF